MQTVVGVLRGGPSREHEVSLETGAAMLQHLPREKYVVRDIYIDRGGVWHDRGRPSEPHRVLRQLDAVLIGMHGEYGEDGQVQKLLERFGTPYVGSDSLSSHFAMHKVLAKVRAREAGLLTPDFRLAEKPEDAEAVAHEAVRAFHQPVVVKPVVGGSSLGVSVVGGYAFVRDAIKKLFEEGAQGVLVEERLRGREASAGVVEGLREERLYALPVVEIIPPQGEFFSYENKYNGRTREVCPGNFSRVITEELQHLAREMHRVLGLRHYSRSDFIVTDRGVYYLETNSLPGLGAESLMPRALQAVGVSLRDFFTHVIGLVA